MKITEIKIKGNLYHIEVKVAGNAKRLKITNVKEDHERKIKAAYLYDMMMRYQASQLNLDISLKGLGLSFVDEKPKELLYLSIYNPHLSL